MKQHHKSIVGGTIENDKKNGGNKVRIKHSPKNALPTHFACPPISLCAVFDIVHKVQNKVVRRGVGWFVDCHTQHKRCKSKILTIIKPHSSFFLWL